MRAQTADEDIARKRLLSLTGAAFWLAVWQAASLLMRSDLVLAGPIDTAAALARLATQPEFWQHIAFSAARIVGGCLTGYAVAGALAGLSHRLPFCRAVLRPGMTAIKSTPVACVVVILLIWFGSANISFVAVLLMTLPSIYFSVLEGLDRMPEAMRELLRAFQPGRAVRALAFTWPQVLPYLTAASRTTLGMSWKAGIAAELIGIADGSLGERIHQAKLLLETADLFAWTAVVVLASWMFERLALAALGATWPAFGHIAAARAKRPRRARETHGATGVRAALRTDSLMSGHAGAPAHELGTMELHAGGILAVLGPSGCGKTTALRTLAGLLAPQGGTVERGDPRVAAVFQDQRLVEGLSAVQNIELFAGDGPGARELLEQMGLESQGDTPVEQLSGGQRRRVEIARALAAGAGIIVLDEPFTGLDREIKAQVIACIRRHARGAAVLLSTHDPRDVQALGQETGARLTLSLG